MLSPSTATALAQPHHYGLGARLRKLRWRRHHSQSDVADRIGVSHQAVSQWETGQTRPTIDNIVSLAVLYGSTVDELLKEPPPPSLTDIVKWLGKASNAELATLGQVVGTDKVWDGMIAPNLT